MDFLWWLSFSEFPGGSSVGSRCCAVAVDESNVVRSVCELWASLKEVVFLVFVLQLNCVYVSDVMMSARVVSYSRFGAILK